jgi:hypothetical protein
MNGRNESEQIATVKYLEDMLGQLRQMAVNHKLEFLAYLIDMAHIEAVDILRRGQSNPGIDKRDSAA